VEVSENTGELVKRLMHGPRNSKLRAKFKLPPGEYFNEAIRGKSECVQCGSSPSSTLRRDCWLTLDGVVPIEKGKQHRDYFVPEGDKPSKQFGVDLGHVRASTLGTNGSGLHFKFKRIGPETSCLIVDAIEQSRACITRFQAGGGPARNREQSTRNNRGGTMTAAQRRELIKIY
jgi:hypothetical protein